jgi:hypothetical protein
MLSPETVGFFTMRRLASATVVTRTFPRGLEARLFGSGTTLHFMQACNETISSSAVSGRTKRTTY